MLFGDLDSIRPLCRTSDSDVALLKPFGSWAGLHGISVAGSPLDHTKSPTPLTSRPTCEGTRPLQDIID